MTTCIIGKTPRRAAHARGLYVGQWWALMDQTATYGRGFMCGIGGFQGTLTLPSPQGRGFRSLIHIIHSAMAVATATAALLVLLRGFGNECV
jgi:hypothetical protein